MKFIHTADLHIDSPLVGLEAYQGAPVERIREATRTAFESIVTLAIEEEVDFVIIAGDLFDGKWRDMQTGLWTAGQFRRLAANGPRGAIPVYIVRGNHDAQSEVRGGISWGKNVREFSVRRAQTFIVETENAKAAIHGQGFAKRAVPEDLSTGYPQPVPGIFNIGVLHTSLTGSAEHDTYAPTSPEQLAAHGYDYWALGHIHRRRIIREADPVIAFAGNSQGRHINEPGAKGCLLVSVEDDHVQSVDFRATDCMRWFRAEVRLDANDDRVATLSKVRHELNECHEASEGRLAAVRLRVAGHTAMHNALTSHDTREEMIAEIRNTANEFDEGVWLEQINLQTAPPIERDSLREGSDLLGDLLRDIDRLAADKRRLADAADCLSPLTGKCAAELQRMGIDPQDPETLRGWLQQAEGLLLSYLSKPDQ